MKVCKPESLNFGLTNLEPILWQNEEFKDMERRWGDLVK